jgi:hypothetical protein
MENQLLRSPSLEAALNLYPNNHRLQRAIRAVLEEQEAYAADELVVLAEEVLMQVAAVGIMHYLAQGDLHKEVYNDYLVQLFTSAGHDHNAGPVYRWTANMVKDCPVLTKSPSYAFFWEADESAHRWVLSSRVNRLGELRNRVMHGFFVLPPEENRKEAEFLGELLEDAHRVGLWLQSPNENIHFIRDAQFAGSFVLSDSNQWRLYAQAPTAFGRLASRIVQEKDPGFWAQEAAALQRAYSDAVAPRMSKALDAILNFVNTREQGAFAVWVHPKDSDADAYCSQIMQSLSKRPHTRLLAYSLHEQGISYTGDFLLQLLIALLNPNNNTGKSDKKRPADLLKAARSTTTDQVIVLINRVHLALFSPQHITCLHNILYENRILLVAVGHHYEHFNRIFHASHQVEHRSVLPTEAESKAALRNYLRFKGPSHERDEDRAAVNLLEEILDKLLKALASGEEVYARRFADAHHYDMEYVHEIFALVHPWLHSNRKPFEEDTIDELYGFPSTMTEVTPIYLALGRRDLKLEYQHKTLSL